MHWTAFALAALLVVTLALFIWGRWRPEIVALCALLVATISTLVPADSAFSGFGHPAVITVAAILVVSQALMSAGLVDLVARPLDRLKSSPVLLLAGLTIAVALLSSFINNVGALALLMPVAVRLARESARPASLFLMPLAFGSLLGGMTTLIGTPPNLIVSGFRATATGEPFRFFDFTPVGAAVAVVGIAFMVLAGRFFVPHRTGSVGGEDLFKVGPYLTEARISAKSPAIGATLHSLGLHNVQIVSIIRDESRITAPSPYRSLRESDLLVMLGESDAIDKFVKEQKLELVGQDDQHKAELLESEEIGLAEAVVAPGSRMIGATAISMRLRTRHGINLIGIAREGRRIKTRLAETRLRAGDVLLLQGSRNEMLAELTDFGCLPLAERPLALEKSHKRWTALAIFAGAILAVISNLLSAPVAFSACAVLMVIAGVITLRQAYNAFEWPVLLLLGAMIPVGLAIESTGLADAIARAAISLSSVAPPWAMLAVVLIVTMMLSDLVNNAAAAVMMCPIAIGVASGLKASSDPFLLAVAIGASCAFLTPIGHQSNLLVMGPGGYKFGDYWRLGLGLEVIIVLVAIPLLMLVWPPL